MKNKQTLLWVYRHSKFLALPVLIQTTVSALLSACTVSFALVSKQVIDAATGVVAASLTEKLIFLAALIFVQLILQASVSRFNVVISSKLEMKLKSTIFNALLHKDLQAVYRYHSGDLLNRITGDVQIISDGFINMLPTVISFSVRLILAMIALFWLDPQFALIYVIFGPLIFIFSRLYSKKMKSLHKDVQESDGKTRSFIQEALQNLLVIKAFHKEIPFAKAADDLQSANYKVKIKRNTISILVNILMYIAFTFSYYFALGWGAFKLSAGSMSFGALTALMQLVGQVQAPFAGLSGIVPKYYAALASAERLMELCALKDERGLESLQDCKKIYDSLAKISFSNVSFSYDDENPVLTNFSCDIKKGDFAVISGVSGIGKSTLLKILLGVINIQKGRTELVMDDGTAIPAGIDTRDLFAYVPQGNMIISGTIRDNICFFKNGVKESSVKFAAKIAVIDKFIDELPNKYDTVIGEKGLGLSEGQAQRIAIARAILSDKPILLLDEATSALDEDTEREFLNNVKSLKSKTCFIVSHKQAAFEACNKIIEL